MSWSDFESPGAVGSGSQPAPEILEIIDISNSQADSAETLIANEPAIIRGKNLERLWHVEANDACIKLCKSQLKVMTLSALLILVRTQRFQVCIRDKEGVE
jgi:hypothetical protein